MPSLMMKKSIMLLTFWQTIPASQMMSMTQTLKRLTLLYDDTSSFTFFVILSRESRIFFWQEWHSFTPRWKTRSRERMKPLNQTMFFSAKQIWCRKTFIIIHQREPLFDLLEHLLSMAIRDKIFAANFKKLDDIYWHEIPPHKLSMKLKVRKECLNLSVFRQSEQTDKNYRISESTPLKSSTWVNNLSKLGLVAELKDNLTQYVFRRSLINIINSKSLHFIAPAILLHITPSVTLSYWCGLSVFSLLYRQGAIIRPGSNSRPWIERCKVLSWRSCSFWCADDRDETFIWWDHSCFDSFAIRQCWYDRAHRTHEWTETSHYSSSQGQEAYWKEYQTNRRDQEERLLNRYDSVWNWSLLKEDENAV